MNIKISKSKIVALAAAVVLLLQVMGLKINLPYINEVIEAACGILIVLGIVSTAKDDSPQEDKEPKQAGEEAEQTSNQNEEEN